MNFGGLESLYTQYEKSKVVVLPVPYDATSTWIKGADRGPDALLDASANMELYDIETDSEVYQQGIFTDKAITEDSSPEKMTEAVKAKVAQHIKNEKFVVLIGGEHSVSIGAIQAHVEAFKDITILQLDAHSDLREEYHGSKCNHACVMARAKQVAPIIQVGIRSMDSSEKESMDCDRVFFAEDIVKSKDWIKQVVSKLTKNVYITIDLDAFDPAIMPSTGTPEPGGLFWYDVIGLLKAVCEKKNVVGLDVVELCPNQNNKGPDFLAAKLIYKLLSYKF
ncbi:MAG: agmatinase [Phycisphaerae bacterium]